MAVSDRSRARRIGRISERVMELQAGAYYSQKRMEAFQNECRALQAELRSLGLTVIEGGISEPDKAA